MQTGHGARTQMIRGATKEELDENIAKARAQQQEINKQLRVMRTQADRDRKMHARVSAKEEKLAAAITALEQTKNTRSPFKLHLDKGTGNTLIILGSSKAGKSHTLMWIYDHYYSPQAIARRKGAVGGDDYRWINILWTHNPQVRVYQGHRKLIISPAWNSEGEDIIAAQKRIQSGTNCHYRFLNMFDDVLDVKNSKLLDNLILSYRNAKMSSIISIQYVFLLKKSMRANINAVILHAFNTDESIESVINTFLKGYLQGLRMPKDQWIAWYKKMTADHAFIYVKPSEGIVGFHRLELGM